MRLAAPSTVGCLTGHLWFPGVQGVLSDEQELDSGEAGQQDQQMNLDEGQAAGEFATHHDKQVAATAQSDAERQGLNQGKVEVIGEHGRDQSEDQLLSEAIAQAEAELDVHRHRAAPALKVMQGILAKRGTRCPQCSQMLSADADIDLVSGGCICSGPCGRPAEGLLAMAVCRDCLFALCTKCVSSFQE